MALAVPLVFIPLLAAAACVQPEPDWRSAEAPLLTDHVELTFPETFVKAGEQYVSPDGKWLIFQAVSRPADDAPPEPFYSMFVAPIMRDEAGDITGLGQHILISPPGSANTCGWFHPTEPGLVMFGSTLAPPSEDQKSGFQVGTRKYVWLFPAEMEIVVTDVPAIAGRDGPPATPTPIFERTFYDAEGSWSADGRFVLYAHVREEESAGRPDADIWVYDTKTGEHRELVAHAGYDGGPFFSPDGRWIVFRSDRHQNDLLQVFAAELRFDDSGAITGVDREVALTDNEHVNWGPFWHPGGKLIVYGTSEIGHWNYEVFALEFAPEKPAAEVRRRRVTSAAGADVLPVFSPDGRYMIWTCQRGELMPGEQKPSSQVWAARLNRQLWDDPDAFFADTPADEPPAPPARGD